MVPGGRRALLSLVADARAICLAAQSDNCTRWVVVRCLALRIVYFVRHVIGRATPSFRPTACFGCNSPVARDPPRPRSALRKAAFLMVGIGGSMLVVEAPLGIFLARHFLEVTFRETAIDLVFTRLAERTLLLGSSPRKHLVNLHALQFLGRIAMAYI